jgi:hypothetical protein
MNTNTNNLVDVSSYEEIVSAELGNPEVNLWDSLLEEANELRSQAVAPRDSWVPFFKNVTFTRRILAVIEDRAEAFDFRAEQAALSGGQPVAARECRIRNTADAPHAWFIY